MKAVLYRAFGAARDVLTLEEFPAPRPGPGEVLVDLAFSGVNPSDVKARAGARAGVTELPYPAIVPHSDGSGVIRAVGEGVDVARVGERVWLWNGQWGRAMGTCAEQIALPAEQAVPLPQDVSLETGAVLGIPGLTAAHVVFSGGPVSGKTLLVQGGAGTVGFLAVQLAKWGGARVIATASAGAAERVRAAGADAVLDYAAPDLAAAVLAANDGAPVDRIVEVEFGANAEVDAAVIAPNGRINAYGSARQMAPVLPFYPLMFKSVTLEMTLVYLLDTANRQAAIGHLHSALSAGALSCPVQEIYALDAAAAAHEAVERGARSGAILVRTSG
ncbi:NADPH:quinone reductase [Ruegeria pomeroyi]|uniref:Oxidoreductase, zinc-binding dehydrogenase family n=2 Tax=Ruegeria pomeroyi TaxID=89184 RepID=Q5LVS9_RUEPO|nr:NADPH:quinone reductase [Ruegeria pomeroyi]HCE71507.1 NADPH:quinone reductase [Ruegeria sp.]AAV93930.1 oxidoreductase, zinc-binding dehydrogenase family [Ruegeria pomeroyi DSS-3]NVK95485.1 NADPH:quinone reductase [Ruegeria pomeroyi]NVL03555.1 NADPH:quinone reductase [Ruegeria pomeroyi]QWV07519.1 NADPH:quinone reductase [Ruegeria pomeroyi]